MNDFPSKININGIVWRVVEANIEIDYQFLGRTPFGGEVRFDNGRRKMRLELYSIGEKATPEIKTFDQIAQEKKSRIFNFEE